MGIDCLVMMKENVFKKAMKSFLPYTRLSELLVNVEFKRWYCLCEMIEEVFGVEYSFDVLRYEDWRTLVEKFDKRLDNSDPFSRLMFHTINMAFDDFGDGMLITNDHADDVINYYEEKGYRGLLDLLGEYLGWCD